MLADLYIILAPKTYLPALISFYYYGRLVSFCLLGLFCVKEIEPLQDIHDFNRNFFWWKLLQECYPHVNDSCIFATKQSRTDMLGFTFL
jgi:hypothetical protein